MATDIPAPVGTEQANEQIRVPYVKVIGQDKRLIGILPTREALALARRQELDLVMLVPNEDPPVCGILDFGRYLYEQKSRQRESKKKQHATEVRDMRMKMKIGPGDYDVKMRKMREFLAEKDARSDAGLIADADLAERSAA